MPEPTRKTADVVAEARQKKTGFPLDLLDKPGTPADATPTSQQAQRKPTIRQAVRQSIKDELSESKTRFMHNIRESVFSSTGVVGSIMRRTWEKRQANQDEDTSDIAKRTFGSIQEIAMNSERTNVTLTRIEKIATNMSENLYNIAGVLKAQQTSLRETMDAMKAQDEEAASESPAGVMKGDSVGPQRVDAWDKSEKSGGGWIDKIKDFLGGAATGAGAAGIFSSVFNAIKPALVTILTRVVPIIGAAWAGVKIGQFLNEQFGISDSLVDKIEEIVTYVRSKKDTPSENPAERAKREGIDKGTAAKRNTQKATQEYGARYDAEAKKNLEDTQASEYGPTPATKPDSPPGAMPTAQVTVTGSTPATPPTNTAPAAVQKETATGEEQQGGEFDYEAFAGALGKRESQGKYDAVNSIGYVGKYQFGAQALEDVGLVKPGVGKMGNKALQDPDNWTIKGGLEAFLSNKQMQEDAMRRFTTMHRKQLEKTGAINKSSSAAEIASILAAAHIQGVGGAMQLARGNDLKDAYGTKASTYAALGAKSQGSGGERVKVAINSGDQLGQASTKVSTMKNAPVAPVVMASNDSGGGGDSATGGNRMGIPSPVAPRGASMEIATRVG